MLIILMTPITMIVKLVIMLITLYIYLSFHLTDIDVLPLVLECIHIYPYKAFEVRGIVDLYNRHLSSVRIFGGVEKVREIVYRGVLSVLIVRNALIVLFALNDLYQVLRLFLTNCLPHILCLLLAFGLFLTICHTHCMFAHRDAVCSHIHI